MIYSNVPLLYICAVLPHVLIAFLIFSVTNISIKSDSTRSKDSVESRKVEMTNFDDVLLPMSKYLLFYYPFSVVFVIAE